MKSLDRKESDSGLLVLTHWITVLLVAAMLTLGLTARGAPRPIRPKTVS